MDENLLSVWLTEREPAYAELISEEQRLVRLRYIPATNTYNIDDIVKYENVKGFYYARDVVWRRYSKRTPISLQREDHDRLEHVWESLGCKIERVNGVTIIAHKEDIDPFAVIFAEGIFPETD